LGQVHSYGQRAEWQTTLALAEHLLTLAQRQADPIRFLWAHHALGTTLFCRGEVVAAHAHLTHGHALYVPTSSRPPVAPNGLDLRVHVRCFAALSLWLLGVSEQALVQVDEARTLAQELSHPFSLAFALTHVTRLYQWLQDVPAILTWTEALLTLSAE